MNSLDSTTITSSNIEITPESPESSSSVIGGRAIDRYNPIITDEKRRGAINRSAPTTNHSVKTPVSPLIMHAPPENSMKTTQNNNNNNIPKPSSRDCVSESESSSRYLLDDTSFLNVLSDFDPLVKLVPLESNKHEDETSVVKLEDTLNLSNKPTPPPSHQVVVLRVSLHCRGCERKLKKHLSRMPGVKSFNIEFTAKKVTVVGDVTPLGVLSNISKVKNAQLWTPTLSSPFPTK